MSAIYFDGIHVLYDHIVVYDAQEGVCEKVHVIHGDDVLQRTLTVCTVGHWALGRVCADFISEHVDSFFESRQSVSGGADIRELSQGNKMPFECFVIDSHSAYMWMFDDSLGVWGRVPRQPFIIGHPRAVAVAAITAEQGIDAVKLAWKALEDSHFFNDKVTRQPYSVVQAVPT